MRKYLPSKHHNNHQYHSKTRKRHLRKKKQYIIPGLGAGLGAGLAGYGYDYGSLAASNNPLGYATPNDATYGGYAAGTAASNALGSSLLPSTATGGAEQRQNLLSSFGGTDGLSSYGNAGLGSYSNNAGLSSYGNNAGLSSYGSNAGLSSYANNAGLSSYGNNAGLSSYGNNAGLSSYSNGASSYNSLNNGGIDPNALSNTIGGGYDSKLTNSLANSLSNSLSNGLSNGLSNSQLNGMNALNSYGAGSDANSYTNLKGLNSLVSSSYNTDGKDLSNLGGKYTATSLSAGLGTPNGISNIANLLNSAATSFDTDAQTQVLANNHNNNGNPNRFGQRFGNHLSGTHSTGGHAQYPSQSTLAEAQLFGNQLSHLSAGKINLGSHSHASK